MKIVGASMVIYNYIYNIDVPVTRIGCSSEARINAQAQSLALLPEKVDSIENSLPFSVFFQ